MAKVVKVKKITKKSKISSQKHPIVKVFLKANMNNSIITLTDIGGKVLAWASSGKVGFKGTRKATPFAAQKATEEIVEKIRAVDASSLHLFINGGGLGREPFVRAMQATGLQIESIKDTTGFPFGGPKPKNRRRV